MPHIKTWIAALFLSLLMIGFIHSAPAAAGVVTVTSPNGGVLASAVSDYYTWYLRLGFTTTFRKKANKLFPRPVNRMLIFAKNLRS